MLCLRTGWSSQQGHSCRRVSEQQVLAGHDIACHVAVCVCAAARGPSLGAAAQPTTSLQAKAWLSGLALRTLLHQPMRHADRHAMHPVQAVRVVEMFACVATRRLTGTAPASSTCSLDTLQRACRLLVFLGYYAPLELDKDPTCDDIVRRLSNLDFFVDFSSSGLDAR